MMNESKLNTNVDRLVIVVEAWILVSLYLALPVIMWIVLLTYPTMAIMQLLDHPNTPLVLIVTLGSFIWAIRDLQKRYKKYLKQSSAKPMTVVELIVGT